MTEKTTPLKVRIYRPAKTAMQSGRWKTRSWIMEFEQSAPRVNDPLMGWTSSPETATQISLRFPSREEAIAHAERAGYDYEVQMPHEAATRRRAYADNFK